MMICAMDGNIPSRKAHSINVMKMTEAFQDCGEEVELVTLRTLPNVINNLLLGDIFKFYGVDNFRIRWETVYNLDFFTRTIDAKGYPEKAAQYIHSRKPDFVHARGMSVGMQLIKNNIPTVLEAHTHFFDTPILQELYRMANNSNFLGLVTIHQDLANEHMNRGIPEHKLLVAESGVDLQDFNISQTATEHRKQFRLSKDKKIVAYCGSLFPEKGIADILEVANRLKVRTEYLFVLAGGNKRQIRLWEDYCRRLEINNVVFIGHIANSRVPSFLNAADILMMPYNTNVDYKQMDLSTTSPLKLFEYAAAARPIVSTKIPTVEKLLINDQSALLCAPNSIDELTDAVIKLGNDTVLANKLAQNASNMVKSYSWQARAQNIIDKFKPK